MQSRRARREAVLIVWQEYVKNCGKGKPKEKKPVKGVEKGVHRLRE